MNAKCENCIYWSKEKENDSDGLCEVKYVEGKPWITTDCGENTIRTSRDFSCIRWAAIAKVFSPKDVPYRCPHCGSKGFIREKDGRCSFCSGREGGVYNEELE